MRVAVLYDIHGNLPALEAVLNDVRSANVDLIVVGGDVLPGPMPRETLECLLGLDLPVQFIHGNGDRVVLAQMRGTEPAEVPDRSVSPMNLLTADDDPQLPYRIGGNISLVHMTYINRELFIVFER